jgi:PTH1 family peptidyl-tRNA hydrolase
MFAFIGLGNPGARYTATRHNVGFRVIDAWLRRLRTQLAPVCDAFHAVTVTIAEHPVVLLKPMTYMNRSGPAVAEACRRYRIDLRHIVVIHDEVHLPFGTLRLRGQGSDGGHNGLASIIQALDTNAFARQRIGVGTPSGGDELIDYVLGLFTPEEEAGLPLVVDRACEQLHAFVTDGWMVAASRYNGAVEA